MAGNFWQSSHCAQWLLERVDLARERHSDLQHLSEDDYQKIIIFFAGFIQTLGEQLKLGSILEGANEVLWSPKLSHSPKEVLQKGLQ